MSLSLTFENTTQHTGVLPISAKGFAVDESLKLQPVDKAVWFEADSW